ncbi:MAG: glycosyltransferase family 2 protein [Rudaea sp.]|uniref:glycosyltransferase family 2 protein n=1 Tax=Rudaea sp. TaxID=2136325 RepID=UPI0039E3FD83
MVDPREGATAADDLTSVVVVTADSGEGTGECLAAALAGTAATEIIVVDNDSHDGGIERVAARFAHVGEVRIVYNGKNLGFGAACNRGAALANGDAVLLLNPDVIVGADTIARLRAVLDAERRIGVVGALQVDPHGRIDPASRRRDPLLRRALASTFGLARFAARWPALAGVDLPWNEPAPAVETVDAVSGALMLLPCAVFESVGGFDEGYFLHCEDLDLCRRVRDAGFRVVCANKVRVVHGKGGSSRHRPVFVAWHKRRGMWRWFRKFDPAARNPLLRALVWCGIWTAFVASVPLLLLSRRRVARAP